MSTDDKRIAERDHNLNELFALVRDFGNALKQHMADETAQDRETHRTLSELRDRVESLATLIQAFPETHEGLPDIHGHRSYHDEIIENTHTAHERWEKVKTDLFSKALTAVMTGGLIVLLLGVKDWLKS